VVDPESRLAASETTSKPLLLIDSGCSTFSPLVTFEDDGGLGLFLLATELNQFERPEKGLFSWDLECKDLLSGDDPLVDLWPLDEFDPSASSD
jgi:hypothetical protein